MDQNIFFMGEKSGVSKFDLPRFYNTRQVKISRSPRKKLNQTKNIFQKNPSTYSFTSKATEQTHHTIQNTQNLVKKLKLKTSFNQSILQVSEKNSESIQSSTDQKDRTKDEDHYAFKANEIIKEKYQILGEGTFGRVFEVKEIYTNKIYALKMIRAVERFIQAAKVEAYIIEKIGQIPSVLEMIEHFDYLDNYCLVFEKLGCSLYDFLKSNNFNGYPIEYIQIFFKQILEQMSYFHCLGLTHTDIKPENILLKHKGKIQYKKGKQQKQKFFVPKIPTIKIIDFGGATFSYEHHSAIINTRQYRAPEVMLISGKWSQKSDMWGIACLIVELYCGRLLFDTHQTFEHLAMIEKLSGQIPKNMIQGCKEEIQSLFSRKKLNWPIGIENASIQRVNKMKILSQIIQPEHQDLQNLLQDLLVLKIYNR